MALYNDYSTYLRNKYGSKVYRIGIDAGFSCPHRCAYCNDDGSRSAYSTKGDPVEKQLSDRIEYLKKSAQASNFIAYFQAFTNTNAPTERLKELYDSILPFREIVGLSIGTRPDCIDYEKLKLISSYMDRYDVWIEYGLQSIHDRTLRAINRGHSFKEFLTSYKMTAKFSIPVSVHVIIGLPGESREDIISTARKLSELKVAGVKIHLLHVLKGSEYEKLYREGTLRILDQDEYAGLVCDFLENLSDDVVVQRLTGQGRREDHIAPLWALDKLGTLQKIKDTLVKRGSRQGHKISI